MKFERSGRNEAIITSYEEYFGLCDLFRVGKRDIFEIFICTIGKDV